MRPAAGIPRPKRKALYAMRVEEAAYGRSSIKLLDRLDKLARWYEAARRYTSERNVYERALAILARSATGKRPAARSARCVESRVPSGSSRSTASKAPDTGGTFNAGSAGAPVFTERHATACAARPRWARALAIIDANQPANQQLRGEVLIDLGDWYLVTNTLRRAYDTYADALEIAGQ